jgi:hypothetical protein
VIDISDKRISGFFIFNWCPRTKVYIDDAMFEEEMLEWIQKHCRGNYTWDFSYQEGEVHFLFENIKDADNFVYHFADGFLRREELKLDSILKWQTKFREY